MTEVDHVIQGIVIKHIGKNTKCPVSACSLKTLPLHWLVSPLSLLLPFIGTQNKITSNEDSSTDKSTSVPAQWKEIPWYSKPGAKQEQEILCRGYLRSWSKQLRRWRSRCPWRWPFSAPGVGIFSWSSFDNFQLLNLLHPLLFTFPRRLKRKLL